MIMCGADSPAKIQAPLTRFIVNWTPGVLSLEYYHQLFDTWLSFWMNSPCHLQILQITRSCRFMSLALVAFKGQACSETYEYRNTFSSCRHLSTSIYHRLKAIISGKPLSFTNFLVSSFLRILFMQLYFRIIFFTSHYCLSSFIIDYLSYLVFLSSSGYFPKLKGPGSMGWHHSDSTEAESPSPQGIRWIPAFWSLGFGWEKSWESDFALAVIFTKMLTSDQISPQQTKTQLFSLEGMRSHRIEMAYPIVSAARCAPQFWLIRQSFCFQAPQLAD